MSKLLEKITQLFKRDQSSLEAFMATRDLKTHADVEYWSKYFEYKGF